MDRLSKPLKKKLRALVALAHERELAQELAQLEKHFLRWRAGEIDAFALNDLVHRYHDGSSRELYKRYTFGTLELIAASAIARGIVSEAEAGPEVTAALGPQLAFMREQE